MSAVYQRARASFDALSVSMTSLPAWDRIASVTAG